MENADQVGMERILTIYNITAPEDGGTYDCLVLNEAGFGYSSGVLYLPPEFVVHPEDVLASEGDAFNLTCLAESFPYPSYQWQMMNRTTMEYVDIPGENNTYLEFPSVTANDFGRYRCVAINTINGIVMNGTSNSSVVTGMGLPNALYNLSLNNKNDFHVINC